MRLLVITGLVIAGVSQGAEHKLSQELRHLNSDELVDVIVQYHQTPTAAHHKDIASRGGELKHELEIIRAAHYSIPAREIEALSNDPDVEFISPDRAVYATWKPVFTTIYNGKPDYGWKTVGADLAKSVFGLDGAGVGVAVIDSGVQGDQDLREVQGQPRVVYSASLISAYNTNDNYGHGSHVAGTAAGYGVAANGLTYQGPYTAAAITPANYKFHYVGAVQLRDDLAYVFRINSAQEERGSHQRCTLD